VAVGAKEKTVADGLEVKIVGLTWAEVETFWGATILLDVNGTLGAVLGDSFEVKMPYQQSGIPASFAAPPGRTLAEVANEFAAKRSIDSLD